MSPGACSRLGPMVRGLAAAIGLTVAGGCATSQLNSARHQFYLGRPEEAAQHLAEVDPSGKDEVLIRMERGLSRQAAGDYEASSEDLLRAIDRLEELETYSLSKGGATWVVNDTMQDFRGKPYERTLLHAFAALNFLALGQWDDAAVEARRLQETVTPERRGDYPDEPFSRYLAAVCFELIGDYESAAFHYRRLRELAPELNIDPRTGRFDATPDADTTANHELICFVLLGRGAQGSQVFSPALAGRIEAPLYAEIQAAGQVLGRSRTLTDTWHLAAVTEAEEAARKAAKTAARIAAKEAVAQSLAHNDQDQLAEIVRLVLIGLLEQPDLRGWQTLPRWLQVARVPCPPDLYQFDVVLRNRVGQEIARHHISHPLQRQGNTFLSFFRDLAH